MNEDIYSDINELVINCQNGDNSALFKLYEYYKPLILASVSRCISKEPKLRAYREDIFKECIFVLKKLVDQYDPNLTYFSYFLSTRIDINLFTFLIYTNQQFQSMKISLIKHQILIHLTKLTML